MQRCDRSVFSLAASILLPLLSLLGCDNGTPQTTQPDYVSNISTNPTAHYRFAIHPLYNPTQLAQAYLPLITYLNDHIPAANFNLEASRDYQAYEEKFRSREPEFILPNPWQTLEAMKQGYQVLAMAGDAEDFKGIFIVRKDSGIQTYADLNGKIVSYPSPTALAACILPQYFLHTHGLNINTDIDNRYVGSQESSITNVYLKQSDVGVTWPPPWRQFQREHPQEAQQLKVIWETPALMNNSIMVRDDVPQALRERVRELLLQLDQTAEGRNILKNAETARFHAATDASYQPVREFIARFEKEVRPVEQK